MLKLLSRHRSIHRSPSLNSTLFNHLPTTHFFDISRCLFHSPPSAVAELDDVYDPPFSPTCAETPEKQKKSKSVKKKDEQPKDNKDGSPGAETLPVKSELPFDFMYSYSETSPGIEPIGFREPPKFSPFGPGRLDRKWTGTTAPVAKKPDLQKLVEERERVLGDPIPEDEVVELVEKYRHSICSRQINLGKFFFQLVNIVLNFCIFLFVKALVFHF